MWINECYFYKRVVRLMWFGIKVIFVCIFCVEKGFFVVKEMEELEVEEIIVKRVYFYCNFIFFGVVIGVGVLMLIVIICLLLVVVCVGYLNVVKIYGECNL